MKKLIIFSSLAILLLGGCSNTPEDLNNEIRQIQEQRNAMESERQSLQKEIADLKLQSDSIREEYAEMQYNLEISRAYAYQGIEDPCGINGEGVRYLLEVEVKQSHFTLDLGQHLKDEMNAFTFIIPVDKKFYDSMSVGDTLANEFRQGSFLLYGSWGDWNLTVKEKIFTQPDPIPSNE